MKWKGRALGIAILLAIGLGVVYMGLRTRASSETHVCSVCNRPIHPESRTIALVDGKNREFCCPACALSLHLQTGKKVQIVQLTDYLTRKALSPEGAFLVEGSRVNVCAQHDMMLNGEGQPMPMKYDRCYPSLLAFGNRQSAQDFIFEHGGTLTSVRELSSKVRSE
jgi:hypothetical protein